MQIEPHQYVAPGPQPGRDSPPWDRWNTKFDPIEQLPVFTHLSSQLKTRLRSVAHRITVPARTILQLEGTRCEFLTVVIKGGKRVYHTSPSGKEITITDVRDGEVCVFNALSVLTNRPYPASAVTLTKTALLVIPADWCREYATQSNEMRQFLLGFVGDGVGQLLELIDDLAFKRMDERLSAYLIERSDHNFVRTTHQMIANDLGTAREVISRILGDFERQGFVSLRRNLIEIHDLT